MRRRSSPQGEGTDAVDRVDEVEAAVLQITDALRALAALLESEAEVDEEVQRGLAAVLRVLAAHVAQALPALRALVPGGANGRRGNR